MALPKFIDNYSPEMGHRIAEALKEDFQALLERLMVGSDLDPSDFMFELQIKIEALGAKFAKEDEQKEKKDPW